MKFKYKVLLIVAPAVFLLDQLTKFLIVKWIPLGERIAVVPGFFDIVHYSNSGAAFGMLAGADSSWRIPFFHIVSVLALFAIVAYIFKLREDEKTMSVVLSLVVGGIFGNGLDRLQAGSVTDFLSFHIGERALWGVALEWPAFNVADSAITIAMVLLIFLAIKGEK